MTNATCHSFTQVVPNLALNFTFYDGLKHWATEPGQAPSTAASLGCGCFAGFLTSTLTYPLDVVRRRMQVCARLSEVHTNACWTPLQSGSVSNSPETTSRAASLIRISVRRPPQVETGIIWMAEQGAADRHGPLRDCSNVQDGFISLLNYACPSGTALPQCVHARNLRTCAVLKEAPKYFRMSTKGRWGCV